MNKWHILLSKSLSSLLSSQVLLPNLFQMTAWVNINNKLAAHKATTLLVFIVLSVMPPNTGMLPTKDVLPANQDTPGTKLPEFAHAVNYQDKLSETTASAHHQRPNGALFQRPAHAQPTLSVTTVFHAQPQESGTTELTLVNAHHQPPSGTETNVSAQLVDMDHHVLNAHLQDTGMSPATNVFAKNHSFGTELTASAHKDISCTKEDALDAQMDILGKTTNVKPAHAPSKIWKF